MTPQDLESIRQRAVLAGADGAPPVHDLQRLLDEVDRLRGALERIAELPDMSLYRPIKRMAQSALAGQALEPLHDHELHPLHSPALHIVEHA